MTAKLTELTCKDCCKCDNMGFGLCFCDEMCLPVDEDQPACISILPKSSARNLSLSEIV